MNRRFLSSLIALALVGVLSLAAFACTSVLVTPGASIDGTATVTQTADCGSCAFEIFKVPAQDWAPGTMVEVKFLPQQTSGRSLGEIIRSTGNFIPQVPHTYAYIGGLFGMINEHQVGIGETTIGGRRDFSNSNGYFDITNLSMLALERGATAREAIQVMGDLAVKYGFSDSGEELSVSDTKEVWMFEIVGPGALWAVGDSEPGAFWVARRVPDGHISVSANSSMIDYIDFNDHENFMFGPGIREFAQEMGWWSPAQGQLNWRVDFNGAVRFEYSYRRVTRIYNMVAPSLANTFTERTAPFSIKVDKKLSLQDIIDLSRDHYEGTQYDATTSLTAGPFNNPRRYLGWNFASGGVNYAWQRVISSIQCEYYIVTQSRGWLPNAIGGVLWYGPTAPAITTMVPLYNSVTELSPSLTSEKAGSSLNFQKESYWWAIQYLNTIVDLKWSVIYPVIQNFQVKYEKDLIKYQNAIDNAAAELYKKSPALAVEFLTNFCKNNVETVRDAAWDLFADIMQANKAGMVVDTATGRVASGSYPAAWLNMIAPLATGDHYVR